jgi:hypothetical protein
MSNPALSVLFLTKMSERLNQLSISELPRFAGYDQQVMRDLRSAPTSADAQMEGMNSRVNLA